MLSFKLQKTVTAWVVWVWVFDAVLVVGGVWCGLGRQWWLVQALGRVSEWVTVFAWVSVLTFRFLGKEMNSMGKMILGFFCVGCVY